MDTCLLNNAVTIITEHSYNKIQAQATSTA